MKVVTQTTANGQTTTATHTLDFSYDASGSPLSVTYNDTTYYYATNLQGDVVAILNGSGSTVVSYTYDAWGYEKACTGTLSGTLGYYNPLRYRGYVYDPEFKLYYLESRYYNPGLGRFNAPDAFAATGQGILGNNMYAYCRNNPVLRTDASGNFDKENFDTDGDPTSDEDDNRGMRASTGSGQLHISRWAVFRTAMKDAAKGLNMAMGERTGTQNHHLFSDKNSTYTSQYKEVTDEYDLVLSDSWNTRTLNHHSGRHTNKYHEFSLEMLFMIDEIAQGDKDLFIEGIDVFGDFIQENDWIPYAR